MNPPEKLSPAALASTIFDFSMSSTSILLLLLKTLKLLFNVISMGEDGRITASSDYDDPLNGIVGFIEGR